LYELLWHQTAYSDSPGCWQELDLCVAMVCNDDVLC